MAGDINPWTTFFRSVISKIRKELSHAELAELLSECAGSENENVEVQSAPTPDDQAMGRGPP